jgi:hypothetical protein
MEIIPSKTNFLLSFKFSLRVNLVLIKLSKLLPHPFSTPRKSWLLPHTQWPSSLLILPLWYPYHSMMVVWHAVSPLAQRCSGTLSHLFMFFGLIRMNWQQLLLSIFIFNYSCIIPMSICFFLSLNPSLWK